MKSRFYDLHSTILVKNLNITMPEEQMKAYKPIICNIVLTCFPTEPTIMSFEDHQDTRKDSFTIPKDVII